MVLLQPEIQKTVVERAVTNVNGQPTCIDLELLEEELTAIATSIPMVLGGGLNGHAGVLLSNAARYSLRSSCQSRCLSDRSYCSKLLANGG